MTPAALPYPSTGLPSFGGVIQQPKFVAPDQAASVDDVIVSDDTNRLKATAPPKLTARTAPPRRFDRPPAEAAPTNSANSKSSRFWEFILGPSQAPATTTAQASRPAATATTASADPLTHNVGKSLLSQFLGTSPPPPRPATGAKLETSPLANQLLLASAEDETTPPTEPRKPTVRDVEEAKTPAASMTISRPGLMQQLGVSIKPPAEPTPSGAGMPPIPTVASGAFDRITSALWGPLVMTSDAPTAAMPGESNVPAAAADNTARLPESERVPSLLRPFYATNPPARGSAAGGTPSVEATAETPQSLSDVFVQSSLGRQMSLASNEDLRTPMAAAIDAQVKHDQQPWDGRVTIQWPLMANPFTLSDSAEPPIVAGDNVAQVAFLQEPLPEPPADGRATDDRNGVADDKSADAGGKKKDEKDTLVGAKTLGTAPEDNTLEFLRTATVLLTPGKSQFDIGIEYTLTENSFPILLTDGMGNVVGVDEVKFKGRELTVPMELRYGLLRRVQGFIQVPVGWSNVQAAINNFDEYENDGGLGDVAFGLTMQIRDAEKDRPYLIGTIAGLAPTGGDPFGVVGTISPSAPSLGNGFWSISGNLLWVQTRYDPVVVFYGFGARYQFAREYIGIEFDPGTEYNYTLGTGFAVNERVTLSAQFFGSYIEELKANGERVEGTIQEPMNLRLAATLAKPCNRIVEPFVTFGLTDDAISANFGITWTY